MNSPIINLEESIGRTVGRRTPTPDGLENGLALQKLAVQFHQSLGQHWARRGVYRFKTHEEADAWTYRMLARSQIPQT